MATGAGEGPADGDLSGAGRKRSGNGGAPDADDWEDLLSLRVEKGVPDEAAPPRVRLSSLRPPAQPGGTPRGGDNPPQAGKASCSASGGGAPTSPQEQVPTAPLPLRPGERWERSGESLPDRQTERQQEMERDEVLEREKGPLRRLSESEHGRRAAEARVAELERELADLHAQMAYERDAARQAIAAGGNGADLERLRSELAAAQEIIHAIEEAYLAGEGFARGGPST